MKNLWMGSLALLLGLASHADWRPGEDRPIQTAQMQAVEKSGTFESFDASTFVKTRQDASTAAPPPFDGMKFLIELGGLEYALTVTEIQTAACGEVRFVARRDSSQSQAEGQSFSITLVEIDRKAAEKCYPDLAREMPEDRVFWSATLTHDRGSRREGHLKAEGFAEPVFTTMGGRRALSLQ